LSDHGYSVVVYDKTQNRALDFFGDRQNDFIIAGGLSEMLSNLKSPRVVLLLVNAGRPVDYVLEDLKPELLPGDIIVDGGNSNFHDSIARAECLAASGINFLDVGISGGEKGARDGPSIVASGTPAAFERVNSILTDIAAKDAESARCAFF
jgi:6-phosphogluconate dehydrogenase